jgi:SRSO17 transposase
MPNVVDRKTVRSWTEELDAVNERIAARFARSEVRGRARSYLQGLLSGVERKNSWQLAESAGDATPYGLQHLLGRALDAGARAAWVVADSAYGDARRLGMFLEEREQPYVLALSGKAYVWAGFRQHRVGSVLDALRRGDPALEEEAGGGWRRLSAGNGSKGPRLYEWLRLPLNPPLQEGFRRLLLARRSTEDSDELTAYTVFAPEGTPLQELAKIAGSRWRVEIGFEEAKGEVGLSHYEVRSWHGWYRHITLALLAHAFLTAARAEGVDAEAPQEKGALGTAGGSGSPSASERKRGLSYG